MPAADPPVRVLVADRNPLLRLGIRVALSDVDQIEVVAEASSTVDALARVTAADVVLVGWVEPIADLVRHAAVIVLSDGPDAVARAIEAGASGYLVHGGYEPSQLAGAVLAAAGGQPCASPAAMTALVQAIRRHPAIGRTAPAGTVLSTRERDVMRLVADGLTNHEVGRRLGLTEKTVKNHLQNIYTRLGVHNRAAALSLWLTTET